MRKSFVLHSLVLILVAGCADDRAASLAGVAFAVKSHKSQRGEEKIIGTSDLLPVTANADNLPEEMRHLVDAVGQLNVGCTATHIGAGLILTAGHCISQSPRSSTTSCRQLGVVWGNRGGNSKFTVSKCLEVKMRVYNDTLDYAILKVENPPQAFIPVELQKPDLPTQTTMLSFPRMRPLEWSGNCEIFSYDDPKCALKKFSHSCDSESGSSGAAILSRESLRIVGVHNGAGDEFNYGMFIAAIDGIAKLMPSQIEATH